MSTSNLPIISLAPFLNPSSSSESRLKTAKDLIEACHSTGFVYITDHTITSTLLSEAFSWNKKFYALPEEEKSLAAHPKDSKIFRGWSKVGFEMLPELEGEKKKGVVDFTESYGMGHDSNPSQPNIWPPSHILPGYRPFIQSFYAHCWTTSVAILRALSLGLVGNDSYLLDFHSELDHELSFRHYPPIEESRVRKGEIDRLGAHTDFDSFTLLWQDEEGGLEVKVRGEGWKSVKSVEGALLMNIGDVLARWSNDYLISTLHRVHLPEEQKYTIVEGVKMTKSRYSIAYFIVPKANEVLKPLDNFLGEGKEGKYQPTTYEELYDKQIDQIFQKDVVV